MAEQRLTAKHYDGKGYYMRCSECCRKTDCEDCEELDKLVDRLGELEDERVSAVDAVPVVRCKDCKHCDPENRHCDHPQGTQIPIPRKLDDFCSYGERKDDG